MLRQEGESLALARGLGLRAVGGGFESGLCGCVRHDGLDSVWFGSDSLPMPYFSMGTRTYSCGESAVRPSDEAGASQEALRSHTRHGERIVELNSSYIRGRQRKSMPLTGFKDDFSSSSSLAGE